MNVRVLVPLRFVQALATGEDHIRGVQQLLLASAQLWRRTMKQAQLVHAVVHGRDGLQRSRKCQRHGCVVPGDITVDMRNLQECVQHVLLCRGGLRIGQRAAQVRAQHRDLAFQHRFQSKSRLVAITTGQFRTR